MASTRAAQQARRLARARRAELDTDRAARDRRIEEATTAAILALDDHATALQAQHHADRAAGTALNHLTREKLRPREIATLINLPESHVKRLLVLAAASSEPARATAAVERPEEQLTAGPVSAR